MVLLVLGGLRCISSAAVHTGSTPFVWRRVPGGRHVASVGLGGASARREDRRGRRGPQEALGHPLRELAASTGGGEVREAAWRGRWCWWVGV